jgi:hypothetical protein
LAPILVPTQSYEDWRRLLARPDRHWKAGFSAMTLARSWEAADGFPDEVREVFRSSGHPHLTAIEPLLVIPEYQVPLPGGRRASQTDVFVIARSVTGLVTIAVEGKVDEAFGPTLAERRSEESEGVATRITFLLHCLGLSEAPGSLRYQLLHRAASAIVAAQQYSASHAVMLVHSFSSSDRWFDDFAAFAKLFNRTANIGRLVTLGSCSGVDLHIGWCKGDQRFRAEAGAATAGVARDGRSRVDSASRVIRPHLPRRQVRRLDPLSAAHDVPHRHGVRRLADAVRGLPSRRALSRCVARPLILSTSPTRCSTI